MLSVTLNFKTGKIKVEDVPTPHLSGSSILVANHYSLISPGTEGYVINMAGKGPVGKALDRPDLARQVINKALLEGFWNTFKIVQNLITAPLPLGYSCAGEVIEVGRNADLFRVSDRVACAGLGMANHAEHVAIPRTMAVKLPDNVSTEDGAFGTLGAIALHGVRLARPELGETFVVFGLGLLGQLTVQILVANGCRVIGFDIDEKKIDLAKQFGLLEGGIVERDDVERIVKSCTGGYGADGVIITAHSKSDQLINIAADVCREKARIIAVGLVNLNVPRQKFFEKELRLEVSRAYGAGAYDSDYERKGIDYPFGYVRWTEGRNLSAFIDLIAQRKIQVSPLITHRIPIKEATKAYELILGERKEPYIGILLTYDRPLKRTTTIKLKERTGAEIRDNLNFGIIGAGRFAQGILLPILMDQPGVKIAAIATGSGLSAKHVANKYNCAMCTSDYMEILNRGDIGSVIIATRHNLHALIVCEALKAQKNIFIEKPLAINEEQLDEIINLLSGYNGILTVGFNRRFSPLCQTFKNYLKNRRQPLVISYRFLTPLIMKGHESEWVHDPEIGGGRIIGEVCHMVDTVSFLVGSSPQEVYAASISGDTPAIPNYDNLQVILRYGDGSIAQLTYVANSDVSQPQERIELYWEGSFGLIDNFRNGLYSHKGKKKHFRSLTQQKGWKEEIVSFVNSIREGKKEPIPLSSLIETTNVTFLIHKSLETGNVLKLNPGPQIK
jgi:predicted dehydrogenase/threonine dehydrogenase-like Zn-dependent dehydrogenase